MLLTEEGCSLSYEERPKGGRLLIPSDHQCEVKYTKQDVACDWYEYRDILEKLEGEFQEGPGMEDIMKFLKLMGE